MAAPPKLTPEQRERIYYLKEKGKSGRAVAELCANGFEDLAPFKVTGQWCNDVWRKMAKERNELYGPQKLNKRPPDEAIAVLLRRGIVVADREMDRLERSQRKGRMNSNQFAALATALKRLQLLAKEVMAHDAGPDEPPKVNGTPQRDSQDDFVKELLSDEEPLPPAEIADVVIPNPE